MSDFRGNTVACRIKVMDTINIQDLQQNAIALLNRVAAGERLIIARDGQPVAELKPVAKSSGDSRPYGLCAGEFVVPDDFDAPLPEDVVRGFEGL